MWGSLEIPLTIPDNKPQERQAKNATGMGRRAVIGLVWSIFKRKKSEDTYVCQQREGENVIWQDFIKKFLQVRMIKIPQHLHIFSSDNIEWFTQLTRGRVISAEKPKHWIEMLSTGRLNSRNSKGELMTEMSLPQWFRHFYANFYRLQLFAICILELLSQQMSHVNKCIFVSLKNCQLHIWYLIKVKLFCRLRFSIIQQWDLSLPLSDLTSSLSRKCVCQFRK